MGWKKRELYEIVIYLSFIMPASNPTRSSFFWLFLGWMEAVTASYTLKVHPIDEYFMILNTFSGLNIEIRLNKKTGALSISFRYVLVHYELYKIFYGIVPLKNYQ